MGHNGQNLADVISFKTRILDTFVISSSLAILSFLFVAMQLMPMQKAIFKGRSILKGMPFHLGAG